jgi:hypothetical protein
MKSWKHDLAFPHNFIILQVENLHTFEENLVEPVKKGKFPNKEILGYNINNMQAPL